MRIISRLDGYIEKTEKKTKIKFREAESGKPFSSELLLAYHGWPTIAKDENGVLYVAASGNRLEHVDPFGESCFYTSRDNGETWSKKVINSSAENGSFVDYRDTGLLYLGNGKMILTYFTHSSKRYTEGPEDLWIRWKKQTDEVDGRISKSIVKVWETKPWFNGSYVRFSNDYGTSWSNPQRVDVSSPHGPTMLRDGTLFYVGNNGDSICSICGTIVYDTKGKIQRIDWENCKTILKSKDYSTETEKIELCEPYAIELESGRILAAVRVQNRIQGKKTHSDTCYTGFCIYVCFSDDKGETWTTLDRLRLAGSPPHLLELKDNVVLMACSQRGYEAPDHPPVFGEYAYLSTDGGETWGPCLTIRVGLNRDCGYPATILQKKDRNDYHLMTVYYENDGTTTNLVYTKWVLEL